MPMLRTIERPTKATLRPCVVGGVEHLLDAVHVAGEAGDDDPARARSRNTVSIAGDELALGHGEAGDLGVGGVGEEEVDALLAEPGEARAGR